MKRLIFTILLGLFSISAQSIGVSGQGTWETTLKARDVDNDGVADAYYDTVLDITWLADANHRATTGYVPAPGPWSLREDLVWIATLNSANLLGANNWRMPKVIDVGNDGCNFSYYGTDCGFNVDTSTGELASLYYDALGNLASFDALGNPQSGYGLTNTGPFSNIQDWYVYGTPVANLTFLAWDIHFVNGSQDTYEGNATWWAVADGDIAVVPVPAAVWLFGSALGLLGWMKRKATPG